MTPTPYYADDLVTLYHGDSREILPHLANVDAIVTDPPYSSGGMYRADRAAATGSKYQLTGAAVRDRRVGRGDRRPPRADANPDGTFADRHAQLDDVLAYGGTLADACRSIGTTAEALEKWCDRRGRRADYNRLAARERGAA